MAEYERNLMRERKIAGLAAARARGWMGVPVRRRWKSQVKVASSLWKDFAIALAEAGELKIKELGEQIDCSRSIYYR